MREITEAAKRAIERLQDTVIDGMIHTPPARAIIEAEFAPLLAAKEERAEEIQSLKMDAANYHGACGLCGMKNCDMLTDDTCVACQRDALAAQVEQLQADLKECARAGEDGLRVLIGCVRRWSKEITFEANWDQARGEFERAEQIALSALDIVRTSVGKTKMGEVRQADAALAVQPAREGGGV